MVDVDIYLNEFAAIVLGYVNGNCNDLNGKESEVCEYIKNQANHAIFNNGYPEDNSNLWDWLKVRHIMNSFTFIVHTITQQKYDI